MQLAGQMPWHLRMNWASQERLSKRVVSSSVVAAWGRTHFAKSLPRRRGSKTDSGVAYVAYARLNCFVIIEQ